MGLLMAEKACVGKIMAVRCVHHVNGFIGASRLDDGDKMKRFGLSAVLLCGSITIL